MSVVFRTDGSTFVAAKPTLGGTNMSNNSNGANKSTYSIKFVVQ